MALTSHVLVQLGQVNAYSDSPIGLGHYDHPCTPVSGGVDTTPSFSMFSSSALTVFRRGIATRRGVGRANGTAPGLSCVVYSLTARPRPQKSWGKRCTMRHCRSPAMVPIRTRSANASIAGRPSSGLRRSSRTNTSCVTV